MVEELHEMNVRLMVSVWGKFKNGDFLKPLRQAGELMKETIWMDPYNPSTRDDFYGFANQSMFSIGVDALWLDATEPEGFTHVDKTVYPYGRNTTDTTTTTTAAAAATEKGDKLNGAVSGSKEEEEGDGQGLSANTLLNGYSLEVTKSISDGLVRDYPNRRVFSLSRSSFAGQQRNGGALWSGDISGSWDMLQRQVGAALGFQLSGMPYWAQDIGGFFRPTDQYTSAAYQELLVRWFQFGAFCPIYRVHGDNSSTELWNYGNLTMEAVNFTTTLRYRMLPYTYSLARRVDAPSSNPNSSASSSSQASSGHYTLQRALAFDFSDDPSVHNGGDLTGDTDSGTTNEGWPDEFMFGTSLLVAPVLRPSKGFDIFFDGVAERNVYLPIDGNGNAHVSGDTGDNITAGCFFNFWTGERHDGGTLLRKVSAPLHHIPLFGRGGSMLVLGPELQWSGETVSDPFLEVRIYPGSDAFFEVYEDNGVDHEYEEQGKFKTTPFTWHDASRTLTVGNRGGCGAGCVVAGVPDYRRILVFGVRLGHGVGLPPVGSDDEQLQTPDAVLLYNGTEIQVSI
jgi:alpha-D-xyloside xylohydrolase